jgi:hypothetical protein
MAKVMGVGGFRRRRDIIPMAVAIAFAAAVVDVLVLVPVGDDAAIVVPSS